MGAPPPLLPETTLNPKPLNPSSKKLSHLGASEAWPAGACRPAGRLLEDLLRGFGVEGLRHIARAGATKSYGSFQALAWLLPTTNSKLYLISPAAHQLNWLYPGCGL